MSENQSDLKIKIQDLQLKLEQKESELGRYREELSLANQAVEKLIARVGQEIKMAAQVQRLLTPTQIPKIPGIEFSTKFVPGSRFGGDYFDIFEHHDSLKFGILLSCSSGHAMSSLFLSVLLKMTSQPQARKGMAPEQLIKNLCKELIPQMSENDRAHFFYGVIDRRSFELNFCLLGQIYAIIYESKKRKVQVLDPFWSDGLTNVFNGEIECMKVQLNPKDRLILCSEGILNSKNASGQIWGGKGVQEALLGAPFDSDNTEVHAIRNNILFKCEQFTGQQVPEKDNTVLVVEVKENILKLA